ncbi:putative transcriptional regulator [Wenjunlia tyrosinilytica]|uniref:Transcriptional regulator n=2 Tax=Wenjunlia tyrosinilytica TaxID=1544741 RepID=A0A917ZNU0_9ACTN|nr:putative transcriptional regulator [Wenjunlia tyrosinilytica]
MGRDWADGRLHRVPALAEYAGRPPSGAGVNWLIVGSDSRTDLSAEQRRRLHVGHAADGGRTDTIMLLHDGDSGPELVSLPRDSYVRIPAFTDRTGRRHPVQYNKANAAFALGGPLLLTRTVEEATGLRLHHYAEIDFSGFVSVVDAVGGVRTCLSEAIHDSRSGARLAKGCRTLDGGQALAFVRARYFDPEGDLGRVGRQRRLLSGLADTAAQPSLVFNPFLLYPLVGSVLEAATVDEGSGAMDVSRLVLGLRGAVGGGARTVPVGNAAATAAGVGDVVLWDRARAEALFDAMRGDRRLPPRLA